MAFKIRQVGTTDEKVFTTKTILELLGDKTNDEITIQDKRYRISSAEELGGGDTSNLVFNWLKLSLQVQQANQQSFSVSLPVTDPEGLLLVVNGLLYDYGQDAGFHLNDNGTILYWHGGFNLSATDKLYVKYLSVHEYLPN